MDKEKAPPQAIPIVEVNGAVPRTGRPAKSSTGQDGDEMGWGSNFWVTLVDPHVRQTFLRGPGMSLNSWMQTQASFFACPTTGQVSWDAPVGHFVYVDLYLCVKGCLNDVLSIVYLRVLMASGGN
jgi:hypothetical protein